MGHAVFELVIAIAAVLLFISNAVALWLIYSKLKDLTAIAPKLESLLDESRVFLKEGRTTLAVVSEVRPSIRAIGETVDKAQDMVRQTSEAVTATTKTIQGQVTNHLHSISALAVAVNQAIQHLLKDRTV